MKQADAEVSWKRSFFLVVSWLWILTVTSIVLMGYRGLHFSEGMSFLIRDGHCNTGFEGFGEHCFGDFGYPYNSPEGGYSDQDLVSVNTPLVLHIFLMLRALPFNFALSTQVILSAAAVTIPLAHALRGSIRGGATLIAPFLFLCSTGIIAAFDRGNRAIWLVPFAYFAFFAWRKDRWNVVFWCVIAAGLLKWWGILLVLLLLASGRIILAIYSVVVTAVIHLCLILSIHFILGSLQITGTLSSRFGDLASDVRNSSYADAVSQYSHSASDFVGRMHCWFSSAPSCDAPRLYLPIQPSLHHAIVSFALLGVWWECLRRRGKMDPRVSTLFFAWMLMAIPQSAVYNLSLMSVAFLIAWSGDEDSLPMVSDQSRDGAISHESRVTEALWGIALAASLVPVPFFTDPSGVGFPFHLPRLGLVKWSMLLPGLWIVVFGLEAVESGRERLQTVLVKHSDATRN